MCYLQRLNLEHGEQFTLLAPTKEAATKLTDVLLQRGCNKISEDDITLV
jgi:hypothetical protein